MRWQGLLYGLVAVLAGLGAVVAAATALPVGASLALLITAVVATVAAISPDRIPQVLLVGDGDARRLELLESRFRAAGFTVARCEGPYVRPCPTVIGGRCPVRARPVATVAYLGDPRDVVPPCERAFHVPTVTIDAGTGVRRPGASRHVSWTEGPQAVVAAVDGLVHR